MFKLSHLLSSNGLRTSTITDIAKSTYYSCGISTLAISDSFQKIFGLGNNHDLLLNSSDLFNEFKKNTDAPGNSNSYFYLFESSYDFSYIVSVLKDDKKSYGFLILGPVFLSQPSEHSINETIKSKNLSLTERASLKNIYANIPFVPNARIYYIQKTITALLNTPVSFDMSHTSLSDDVETIDVSVDVSSDYTGPDYNYSFEKLFLDKVSSGDIDQVIELFNEQIKSTYLSHPTETSLKNSKYDAIIFNTLLSRAAISGGVDPEFSLDLSKKYVKLIDDVHTNDELIDLLETMVAKYTNSVLHIASINHVSVIKKASRYVHNHLSEPIRLQEVADYVGLSPNYFSSLFKKEMNLAFADYVNHTRIKESQYLLHTTNHTILDIARSVGFNNQNYFTTIFKKTTGITPKQYRMRSNMKH